MTACACIGPVGDCPCIRRAKGLPVPITETYISPELFALLPDGDKEAINRLKLKAFGLFMTGRRGGAPEAGGCEADGGSPAECGRSPMCGCPAALDAIGAPDAQAPAGDTEAMDWLEQAYSDGARDEKAWREFMTRVAEVGFRRAIGEARRAQGVTG